MSRILGVSPKRSTGLRRKEVPNIKVDQLDRFITHFHLNVEKACQIPFELWDKQTREVGPAAARRGPPLRKKYRRNDAAENGIDRRSLPHFADLV